MDITVATQSILQAWITKQARETVAFGRELLGGNGIVTDFHVGKVLFINYLSLEVCLFFWSM